MISHHVDKFTANSVRTLSAYQVHKVSAHALITAIAHQVGTLTAHSLNDPGGQTHRCTSLAHSLHLLAKISPTDGHSPCVPSSKIAFPRGGNSHKMGTVPSKLMGRNLSCGGHSPIQTEDIVPAHTFGTIPAPPVGTDTAHIVGTFPTQPLLRFFTSGGQRSHPKSGQFPPALRHPDKPVDTARPYGVLSTPTRCKDLAPKRWPHYPHKRWAHPTPTRLE
jgi:hypothetical protein